MSRRDDLIDLLARDEVAFASAVGEFLATEGGNTTRRREVARAGPEAFAGPDDLAACDDLMGDDDRTRRERDLVWRLWLLDEIPFGLTLSGPAYQDTPFATSTGRSVTSPATRSRRSSARTHASSRVPTPTPTRSTTSARPSTSGNP